LTKRTTYTLGADVPADEVLRDTKGRVVDEGYVESAVEDALAIVRGRGRPSLSQSGESPLLRVRLSRELDEAVRKAAEVAGTSRSEWVRHALEEASRRTG
jgi:predicted HicB family RNase H-like nuclease